jgi:hypothetical protein
MNIEDENNDDKEEKEINKRELDEGEENFENIKTKLQIKNHLIYEENVFDEGKENGKEMSSFEWIIEVDDNREVIF